MKDNPDFSILITTKNRLEDLKFTLQKIDYLIKRDDVECMICDDGSTDGTSAFIKQNYPSVQLLNHHKSVGLIASRNELLNLTKAKYAISLDDDAHIVSENALETIGQFFKENQKCAVMAFRIFWGKTLPENQSHSLENTRVKGFVGCGHVWRMEVWRSIPNYPDWFVFYGEEEFAGYHLFKKNWEVWFLPNILVHHRIDVKARKQDKDYQWRLRRSLRSGWYLYIMFYPLKQIPKKLAYTLWMQLRLKVFKGDLRALLAILGAIFSVLFNIPRLIYNRDALNSAEYKNYQLLPDTKLYWSP